MIFQKKAVKIGAIVLLCVVLIVVGIFAGIKISGRSKTDDTKTVTPKKTVQKITVDIVKEKIITLGELVTAEYDYTSVASETSSKNIKIKDKDIVIPMTKAGFVFSYDGVIKAGINFEEIEVSVDDSKKKIIVKLPEAKIISSELNDDSFQLYDEKNSLFNQISVSDVTKSTAELKEESEKRAIKKGLLDNANENAELLIRNLLESALKLVDNGYEVVFEKVD